MKNLYRCIAFTALSVLVSSGCNRLDEVEYIALRDDAQYENKKVESEKTVEPHSSDSLDIKLEEDRE